MFKQYETLQHVLSTVFVIVTLAGIGIPLVFFVVGKIVESFSSQRTYAFDSQIQARMERLGLTSWKDLCKAAGVRRSTLDLLRQGEVDVLRLKQLRRLGEGLGLSVPDVLRLVDCADFGKSKSVLAPISAPGSGFWQAIQNIFNPSVAE